MAKPFNRPTLYLYDEGKEVKELQELLNQWNLPVEVNGKFETETQDAVQNFQKSMNIIAEGIVGPLTWAALLGVNVSELNVSTSPTRQVIEEKDVNQKVKNTKTRLLNRENVGITEVVQAKTLSKDDYVSKLLKYIPTEVIGVYLTLDALVRSSRNIPLYWAVFLFGLIVTPIYLWRVQKVYKRKQLFLATGAFLVWVFATGGPFVKCNWYNPLLGGVVLIIYTFLLPLL